MKILIKQRNFLPSWAVSARLSTTKTGTVELFETSWYTLTNQKSELVRNDLHTKLTPAPKVFTILILSVEKRTVEVRDQKIFLFISFWILLLKVMTRVIRNASFTSRFFSFLIKERVICDLC